MFSISPIYFLVFFLVLLLAQMAEAYPKKKVLALDQEYREKYYPNTILVLLIACILIVMAGFRYYVGTDFGAYYHHPGTWEKFKESVITHDEPGICLIAALANSIYKSPSSLIFTASLITIGIYIWQIYKYSLMFTVSMMMLFFLEVWTGSFNGVRQFLAAAILFAGHHLIVERKFWKYCIIVVVAALFHTTAVIMIVPYFLLCRKSDWKQICILALGALVIMMSYRILFDAIGGYKGTVMNMEDSYLTKEVNILRIMASFIPAFFYLFFCNKKNLSKEDEFYINGVWLYGFSMLATMNSAYLARVGIYSCSMVIISWGHLFHLLKDKQHLALIILGIMVVYFIYWCFALMALHGEYYWIFHSN